MEEYTLKEQTNLNEQVIKVSNMSSLHRSFTTAAGVIWIGPEAREKAVEAIHWHDTQCLAREILCGLQSEWQEIPLLQEQYLCISLSNDYTFISNMSI